LRTKLTITHNAGFFSCCSIRLERIMQFYNEHQRLPDIVNSSQQFATYKTDKSVDLIPFFFKEQPSPLPWPGRSMAITNTNIEPQYSPYHLLELDDIIQFRDRYFTPSDHVLAIAATLEKKYALDYANTCAVFYRGNDKYRETVIAPYQEFYDRCSDVQDQHNGVRFLVQPDESEFLYFFQRHFPNSVAFSETPHITKRDSVVFNEVPVPQRRDYAATFLQPCCACRAAATSSPTAAIAAYGAAFTAGILPTSNSSGSAVGVEGLTNDRSLKT